MNPNLMYGIVKEEPPLEDSYRIPGFEEYRDGIKLVSIAPFSEKQI